MNRFIEKQKGVLEETISLRTEILNAVKDADLHFSPGGKSLTLQDLLLEQASIQSSYIHAFKTFKQDWSIKATLPDPITLDAFECLFTKLDKQLFETLEQLSENDLTKSVDRGGWNLSIEGTLIAYHEAVLIFSAKASIYLKATNKTLSGQLGAWIG
ncbi:MAG: hypothetical protein ACRCYY_20610 [Trueperaceae bacterium]